MILVVDANILVSELLRVRGRELIARPELRVFIAERTWDEARHELKLRADQIVAQNRLTRQEVDVLLEAAIQVVDDSVAAISDEMYLSLMEPAASRIPRDPDDLPTVALALAFGGDQCHCGIWTNDGDFLGCGIPVWTTETLLAYLNDIEDG